MAIPIEKTRMTVTEYLHREEQSLEKHEYWHGDVLLMAGGSETHSLITANVIGEVRNALKGKPCRVYDSNLRIRLGNKPLYAYPDASVICGPAVMDEADRNRHTATNPKVIIEVLSPSTASRDRVDKFKDYLDLATLEEYVLVEQDAASVDVYTRQSDGTWLLSMAVGMQAAARLRSLEVTIPLREIYAGVRFPTPDPTPAG